MCDVLGVAGVATASENVEIDDANQVSSIRLIDVEQELLEYLDANYPEMFFGSEEFIEYAVDVLMYDIDDELALFDNYADIRFYLGEYLYQLELEQARSDRSVELLSKVHSAVYELPDEYKMQLIGNMKSDIAIKMLNEERAYTEGRENDRLDKSLADITETNTFRIIRF